MSLSPYDILSMISQGGRTKSEQEEHERLEAFFRKIKEKREKKRKIEENIRLKFISENKMFILDPTNRLKFIGKDKNEIGNDIVDKVISLIKLDNMEPHS